MMNVVTVSPEKREEFGALAILLNAVAPERIIMHHFQDLTDACLFGQTNQEDVHWVVTEVFPQVGQRVGMPIDHRHAALVQYFPLAHYVYLRPAGISAAESINDRLRSLHKGAVTAWPMNDEWPACLYEAIMRDVVNSHMRNWPRWSKEQLQERLTRHKPYLDRDLLVAIDHHHHLHVREGELLIASEPTTPGQVSPAQTVVIEPPQERIDLELL